MDCILYVKYMMIITSLLDWDRQLGVEALGQGGGMQGDVPGQKGQGDKGGDGAARDCLITEWNSLKIPDY